MKNTSSFIALILFFLIFSCTTTEKTDNTFLSVIENKSDFTVTIDNETVASGTKTSHNFPLHESALYDGWNVQYEIPLTEDVSYIITDKILVADNQKSVAIENPKSASIPECYAVIQNSSNDTIQITDSANETIFKCYDKGTVNRQESSSTHNIAPNSKAVCKIGTGQTELYASNSTNSGKAKLIKLNAPFKKGYVYKIRIEDNKATLTDLRPLQQLCEKSWEQEYKDRIILSAMQKGENIYLLGTATGKDKKENSYKTGFIQCLDVHGGGKWLQPCDVRGADTYLYDMAFNADGTILVAGQSIDSHLTGLFFQYSEDGELVNNVTVSESIYLDRITPLYDGSPLLHGEDGNNNPVYFKVAPDGSYEKSSALCGSNQTKSLIQSESKYIEDKNGGIYIAGETSYGECPAATIAYVPKNSAGEAVYTAREPFSFASDMILNQEQNQLVFVGYVNAKDDCGNGGTPFIRCLDLQTKKILWETIYENCGYEVCMKIAGCEDYGYILIFANVGDEDGCVALPCKVTRTNATGR